MVTDSQRKETGRQGEQAVCDYLTKQGYRVVARNWHCKRGEIDVIATHGDIIAFVEVKTRKAGAMVSPLAAVDYRKQRRTVITASLFLSSHSYDLQPRFDVAAVTPTACGMTVEHLQGAYDAGGIY